MRGLLIVLVATLAACSDGDKKKTNDPCANNTDCADNICHSGICVSSSALSNGSKCGGNGECKSLSCEGGACGFGKAKVGGSCLFDEECNASGELLVKCTGGKCGGASIRTDAGLIRIDGGHGTPDGGATVTCTDPPQVEVATCTYTWTGCSDGKPYKATCSQVDGTCACIPDAQCKGMIFSEGCMLMLAPQVATCCKFPIRGPT
jgi:hypothetical protein